MNKLVVLFTAAMFLVVFSLIGCNKPQEQAKPEAAPAQEPAAAPEQEPAKVAKPKPLPTVGNVLFIVKDVWEKRPIKEAIVNVTINQKMQVVKTNAAGKALFKGLHFGGYTFTVASPNGSLVPDVVNVNVTVPRGATATRTVTLRIRQ